MTFAPAFSRPFSPTFDRRNAGGFWWNLFGAIPAASIGGAYQPKGAADLAGSYVNLANPGTNNMTTTSAPDWDVTNGWKKTSDANFLDTGIVSATGYSMMIRFTSHSNVGAYSYICGQSTANANCAIGARETAGKRSFYNSGGLVISGEMTAGIMAVAGTSGFTDGAKETGSCAAWSTTTTKTLYALSANGLIGANSPDGLYVQAFAIYKTILTDAQMLALYTAMAAL